MIRSFLLLSQNQTKIFLHFSYFEVKTYSKKDHLSSLKISNIDD